MGPGLTDPAPSLSLKIKYVDSCRKVFLPSSPPPAWSRLALALRDRFQLAPNQTIGLRYLDPESDLITISSQVELDELWDEIRAGAKLKEKEGVSRKVVRLDLVILNSSIEPAASTTQLPVAVPEEVGGALPRAQNTTLPISNPSEPLMASKFFVSFEIAFERSETVFPFDFPYSVLPSLDLQSFLAMGRNVFDLPESMHLSLHHDRGDKLNEIFSQEDLQRLWSVPDHPNLAENAGKAVGPVIRLVLVESSSGSSEDTDGFVNVLTPLTVSFEDDTNVPHVQSVEPLHTKADLTPANHLLPFDDLPVSPNLAVPAKSGGQKSRSTDGEQPDLRSQPESAPDPPEEVAEDNSDPSIEPLPMHDTTTPNVGALPQLFTFAVNQTVGLDVARTIGTYATLLADVTGQLSHVCRNLAEHVNTAPPSNTTPAAPSHSPPVSLDQPTDETAPPSTHDDNLHQPTRPTRDVLVETDVAYHVKEPKPDAECPLTPFEPAAAGAEAKSAGLPEMLASDILDRGAFRSPLPSPFLASHLGNACAPDSTWPAPPRPEMSRLHPPQPTLGFDPHHLFPYEPPFHNLPWQAHIGFGNRSPTPFYVGHVPHHKHRFHPRPPCHPYSWHHTTHLTQTGRPFPAQLDSQRPPKFGIDGGRAGLWRDTPETFVDDRDLDPMRSRRASERWNLTSEPAQSENRSSDKKGRRTPMSSPALSYRMPSEPKEVEDVPRLFSWRPAPWPLTPQHRLDLPNRPTSCDPRPGPSVGLGDVNSPRFYHSEAGEIVDCQEHKSLLSDEANVSSRGENAYNDWGELRKSVREAKKSFIEDERLNEGSNSGVLKCPEVEQPHYFQGQTNDTWAGLVTQESVDHEPHSWYTPPSHGKKTKKRNKKRQGRENVFE